MDFHSYKEINCQNISEQDVVLSFLKKKKEKKRKKNKVKPSKRTTLTSKRKFVHFYASWFVHFNFEENKPVRA